MACTITKLTSGTVVFEDVGSEHFKGQVLKPIDRAQKYASDGDALNGRIKYRAEDRSEVEVPFGEKDQVCPVFVSVQLMTFRFRVVCLLSSIVNYYQYEIGHVNFEALRYCMSSFFSISAVTNLTVLKNCR